MDEEKKTIPVDPEAARAAIYEQIALSAERSRGDAPVGQNRGVVSGKAATGSQEKRVDREVSTASGDLKRGHDLLSAALKTPPVLVRPGGVRHNTANMASLGGVAAGFEKLGKLTTDARNEADEASGLTRSTESRETTAVKSAPFGAGWKPGDEDPKPFTIKEVQKEAEAANPPRPAQAGRNEEK